MTAVCGHPSKLVIWRAAGVSILGGVVFPPTDDTVLR